MFAAFSACVGLAACDDSGDLDPCAYVACSSRGYCETMGGRPVCRCIPGYHAVDLECVPDSTTDADASGPDEAAGEGDGFAEGEVPDGVPCTTEWECGANQACRDGICTTVPCWADSECPVGELCADGFCQPWSCRTSADCGAGDYCDRHGCDPGTEGYCQSIDGGTCPGVYVPVCGCDGRVYANDCERIVAGVALRHTGECG